MEITFGGGAFAEVAGHNALGEGRVVLSLEFERVGCPGGLWDLGSEGAGNGVDVEGRAAVVHRHVPSLAEIEVVGEELIHELWEREPALGEHAGFPILREDRVVRGERGGATDCDAFLARGDHVEGDSALPLRGVHDCVKDGD